MTKKAYTLHSFRRLYAFKFITLFPLPLNESVDGERKGANRQRRHRSVSSVKQIRQASGGRMTEQAVGVLGKRQI